MARAGALRFDINAIDKSGAAFRRVQGHLDTVDRKITAVSRTAAGFGKLFGIGLAAGGVIALADNIRRVVEETAKIGHVADKVGLATSELQALRFAAEQTGVASNTLDMAMQRFSRRVGEAASGSGELVKILKANDLALRKADGSMRPINAILKDYADLIKNAGSEQEQLLLSFKGFDSEGAALVNAFREGGEAIDEAMRKIQEIGGVIDEEGIKKAKEFDDAWGRLTTTIGSEFKTGVISAVTEIDRISDKIDEFVNDPSFTTFMEALGFKATGGGALGLYDQFFGDAAAGEPGGAIELAGGKDDGVAGPPLPGRKPRRTVIPGTGGSKKTKKPSRDRGADVIARLKFEAEQLGRTAEEQKVYNQLKRAGVDIGSAQGTQIEALVLGITEEERAIAAANEQAQFFAETMSDAITSMLFDAESLDDVFSGLAKTIAKAALEAALFGGGPLGGAFGGGGADGGVGGLFGAAFGGARAGGGPVSSGRAYLVGESGRELFIPDRGGTIVSNGQLGAGGNSDGGTLRIEISMDDGGAWQARVRDISTQAAVQVVAMSSPSIRRGAVSDVNEGLARGDLAKGTGAYGLKLQPRSR